MGVHYTMFCPHCGTRAKVRTSAEKSRTMREITYQCNDVECGHSFVGILEVVRTLSPSGKPHPDVDLPMSVLSRHAKEESRKTVQDHVTNVGSVELDRNNKKRGLSPEDEKRAMQLWATGKVTKGDISQLFGVTYPTVDKAIARSGLAQRFGGQPLVTSAASPHSSSSATSSGI